MTDPTCNTSSGTVLATSFAAAAATLFAAALLHTEPPAALKLSDSATGVADIGTGAAVAAGTVTVAGACCCLEITGAEATGRATAAFLSCIISLVSVFASASNLARFSNHASKKFFFGATGFGAAAVVATGTAVAASATTTAGLLSTATAGLLSI